MRRPTANDQLITQYLLGSLSVPETERLDELSLTDDEFATRLQSVENDLVDAYVLGELSGETLQQFNSFYLSSPRRREKVKFAQVFHPNAEYPALREPVNARQASRRIRFRKGPVPAARCRCCRHLVQEDHGNGDWPLQRRSCWQWPSGWRWQIGACAAR